MKLTEKLERLANEIKDIAETENYLATMETDWSKCCKIAKVRNMLGELASQRFSEFSEGLKWTIGEDAQLIAFFKNSDPTPCTWTGYRPHTVVFHGKAAICIPVKLEDRPELFPVNIDCLELA